MAAQREPTLYFDANSKAIIMQWGSLDSLSVGQEVLLAAPTRLGGLGITSQAIVGPAAYTASRNFAFAPRGARVVSQKVLAEAIYKDQIARVSAGNELLARRFQMGAEKGAAAGLYAHKLYVNCDVFGALLRYKLLGTASSYPVTTIVCPGCGYKASSVTMMLHLSACVTLPSGLITKRHNNACWQLRDDMKRAGDQAEDGEPRDLKLYTCNCKIGTMSEQQWTEHRAAAIANNMPCGGRALHGAGPDIRAHPLADGGASRVYDVTIHNPDVVSNAKHSFAELEELSNKAKNDLYGPAVADKGEKLTVLFATSDGVLGSEYTKVVKNLAARNYIDVESALNATSARIQFGTGAALLKGEREAKIAPPSIAPESMLMTAGLVAQGGLLKGPKLTITSSGSGAVATFMDRATVDSLIVHAIQSEALRHTTVNAAHLAEAAATLQREQQSARALTQELTQLPRGKSRSVAEARKEAAEARKSNVTSDDIAYLAKVQNETVDYLADDFTALAANARRAGNSLVGSAGGVLEIVNESVQSEVERLTSIRDDIRARSASNAARAQSMQQQTDEARELATFLEQSRSQAHVSLQSARIASSSHEVRELIEEIRAASVEHDSTDAQLRAAAIMRSRAVSTLRAASTQIEALHHHTGALLLADPAAELDHLLSRTSFSAPPAALRERSHDQHDRHEIAADGRMSVMRPCDGNVESRWAHGDSPAAVNPTPAAAAAQQQQPLVPQATAPVRQTTSGTASVCSNSSNNGKQPVRAAANTIAGRLAAKAAGHRRASTLFADMQMEDELARRDSADTSRDASVASSDLISCGATPAQQMQLQRGRSGAPHPNSDDHRVPAEAAGGGWRNASSPVNNNVTWTPHYSNNHTSSRHDVLRSGSASSCSSTSSSMRMQQPCLRAAHRSRLEHGSAAAPTPRESTPTSGAPHPVSRGLTAATQGAAA